MFAESCFQAHLSVKFGIASFANLKAHPKNSFLSNQGLNCVT